MKNMKNKMEVHIGDKYMGEVYEMTEILEYCSGAKNDDGIWEVDREQLNVYVKSGEVEVIYCSDYHVPYVFFTGEISTCTACGAEVPYVNAWYDDREQCDDCWSFV